MEYILVQHEGFKEEYLNQIKPLEGVSSDELVRRYNKEVDTGIVGVYAQGIFLAALRIAFIKKFKQSPILIKDNVIIRLTDKVKIKEEALYYFNNERVGR